MSDAIRAAVAHVQAALTDDLRRAPWSGSTDPLAGHCYVASEAAYHLLGGPTVGWWRPATVRHEGAVHWYLVGNDGVPLDLTASQFCTPVPYHLGRRRGFLTTAPSKRAQVVLGRVAAALAK